ncbi:MAG: nucleotidyltransferase domain-containing protein [Clostridia bacterium]|nr:nucleotidyltransferase domain-containing protein [Clostridia bacterium]
MERSMAESIEKMLQKTADAVNGRVHSAWLYGSIVWDDFRLGWSDIDWLVLTDREITESQAQALLTLRQAMLEKEPGNPYYRSFEGIIASLEEYRSRSFRRLVYWGTSGQRVTDRYVQDAFSAYELAKYGRCILGQADRSIFPAQSQEELIAAVRAHYGSIRAFAAQTDERLYSCGWLMDIARCVYTLRCHGVIAKTQAGIWALENHIFPDEAPLCKALEIRRDPLAYKDRVDVQIWLSSLGPTVQRYADTLEKELSASVTSGPETDG